MSIESFNYNVNEARIIFGNGTSSRVASEMEHFGRHRALVLSTPVQKKDAEDLAARLGSAAAGVFTGATMHTPVEVTAKAMAAFNEARADCVVAIGGGSTVGLGKAIAWRNDTIQIVVATTYAGSEVTPFLGETENKLKVLKRDPRILPEVVIYDPELTLSLPVRMSAVSGMNAMAHAVEGLYAEDRNPITSLQAIAGIKALREALPTIIAKPTDRDARSLALYGAWLCGTVLGTVGVSLHHKLCHTLGGTFNLPHAETHAVVLPHSAAYNAVVAVSELAPVAEMFGGSVGGGLFDFISGLKIPLSLRELGMKEEGLDLAADLAMDEPYWNPRPVERAGIRALLQHAWEGTRPE